MQDYSKFIEKIHRFAAFIAGAARKGKYPATIGSVVFLFLASITSTTATLYFHLLNRIGINGALNERMIEVFLPLVIIATFYKFFVWSIYYAFTPTMKRGTPVKLVVYVITFSTFVICLARVASIAADACAGLFMFWPIIHEFIFGVIKHAISQTFDPWQLITASTHSGALTPQAIVIGFDFWIIIGIWSLLILSRTLKCK